jgi:hypothetical protein
MEAAIMRLQVTHNECYQTVCPEGYQAGKRWAESAASFDQLKRLSDFTDQLDSGPACRWRDFFTNGDIGAYTASEVLACYIQSRELDRELARDFWRSALERVTPPERDFLRDFAEGATETDFGR